MINFSTTSHIWRAYDYLLSNFIYYILYLTQILFLFPDSLISAIIWRPKNSLNIEKFSNPSNSWLTYFYLAPIPPQKFDRARSTFSTANVAVGPEYKKNLDTIDIDSEFFDKQCVNDWNIPKNPVNQICHRISPRLSRKRSRLNFRRCSLVISGSRETFSRADHLHSSKR
jgi:hypothetical protein